MKRLLVILSAATALAGGGDARAQTLQDAQSAQLFATTNDFQRGVNWQSQRGVPLSGTVNSPTGSDGRVPAGQPASSAGQFQGIVSYGAVTYAATPAALSAGGSFAANAEAIDYPRAKSGATVTLILRAQAGAYYIGQEATLLFGAVIPVPDSDLDGVTFANSAAAAAYWEAEPFTTNNHAGAAYYWSPHAGKVFAIQSGEVGITWRRKAALAEAPADFAGNENVKYALIDGNYYPLLGTSQVVSDGAFKLTRKLYWTEGVFTASGKRVTVPPAVVKDIHFGYNPAFPRYVASNEVFVADGTSSPLGADTALLDTRTVWLENGFICAFNREGRLFVELLGNTITNDVREFLGFELVDVTREPAVDDVTTELGERMTAHPNNSPSDANLRPSPFVDVTGTSYSHQLFIGADGASEVYATRVTPELNSSKVHWLAEGVAGLWWPERTVRYRQIWPADVSRYSHYLRPLVGDEQSAQATAVAVPAENSPVIEYEDPTDIVRSKFTTGQLFYTYLDAEHPVLRTLIRYNSADRVAFERVFSWLDTNLRATNFANTPAAELSAWDATNGAFNFANPLTAPRIVEAAVQVGQRINPPAGEATTVRVAIDGADFSNSTEVPLTGYIRTNQGTGYSVTAYVDPFAAGFAEAATGAIIPVTASNNNARLEVWWYRANNADTVNGFQKTYWPSIMGRYTVSWPGGGPTARQIVLASNAGSGALTSLEAKGSLYIQNDPNLPGYNPNEEHALLQGGQAWALRDDLNITDTAGYSSHPCVLLEHADADGRPSMTAFQVVREQGDVTFDFTRQAGTLLQAPMPLPLLERPLGTKVIGAPARSLNAEVGEEAVAGNTVAVAGGIAHVTLTTMRRHFFQPYEQLALQITNGGGLLTRWFYSTNGGATNTELGGVVSAAPALSLDTWTAGAQPVDVTHYRFKVGSASGLAVAQPVLIANAALRTNWLATVADTNVVTGDTYVEVAFSVPVPAAAQSGAVLVAPEGGVAVDQFADWRVAYEPQSAAITDPLKRSRFASFTYQDRKGDVWFYRGPHSGTGAGKLVMQFYYKTLDGFYFPSLAADAQPPAGTITPYLRSQNSDGGYEGDPVYADANADNLGDGNALGIVYHPVWPDDAPVLMMAETLALPKRGLPSVRGQTSVGLLYQQPQFVGGLTARAVVLHDPTREKQLNLTPKGSAGLSKLPTSVVTSGYQGLTYFPNLPPHLVERFFHDSNRGVNGALVLRGQFKQEVVGDNYMLLNVLGPSDLDALRNLCIAGDPLKSAWDAAITGGLGTRMERHSEDPGRPGSFKPVGVTSYRIMHPERPIRLPFGGFIIPFDTINVPDPTLVVGPTELAEAWDQDVAVDSYALTAMGPGSGYVTLVMGDGSAFTPAAEPVSLQIIKVSDALYPGELKIVKPSNPLSEMLTLQQVVDLGGQIGDYEFEWLIAAPVQGVPPLVYQNTRQLLLGDGTWQHLRHPLPADQPATVHAVDPGRALGEIQTTVVPVSLISFVTVTTNDDQLSFVLTPGTAQPLAVGVPVSVTDAGGNAYAGTVVRLNPTNYQSQPATNVLVALDAEQENLPGVLAVSQLFERVVENEPQSIAFREFTISENNNYSQYLLSLELDPALGAKVYLDGQLVAGVNLAAGNTPTSVAPPAFSPLANAYVVDPNAFSAGQRSGGVATHRFAVEFFSAAQPGANLNFNLRLEAFQAVDETAQPGTQWLAMDPGKFRDKVRAIMGTGADVRALSDNYVIARYRATNTTHVSYARGWSRWTEPQLAEGWIKRVLAGINPFNQRTTDLFNNSVSTDASILVQAGKRWEGDVALNLENINNYGLIEIYETVLRRGRNISIDAGINYGPANDALLLAATYLNDLYVMLGNEAWADAANPTIGIGTKDPNLGDIATALFAFRGQMATLLEEELALLRGRDDFLQPGVQASPVYNRLFWNYTRGIDAGEVIYALNYDIQPLAGSASIDAAAAAHMFPQGHGDAYGHYLTAVTEYFSLFISPNFDWVPHSEAVTVLGHPVQVNYQNERKFAAAAANLARAGSQVLDLTWRRDYQPGGDVGWQFLATTATNTTRQVPTTRYWGVDQWASRTMQGTYFNWALGNAILPAEDPDPTHEGIQKVDRTTVPELLELPETALAIQITLDNAEAHATPLGLPAGSLAFDVNPNQITGANSQTHFEQIYGRAVGALNNAVVSFDDAKGVTRLMRSEQDNLADYRTVVDQQELAYTNQLIEIFGTPYTDDIGPGLTYDTGYTGPDLFHFAYVNNPQISFQGIDDPTRTVTYTIDFSRRYPAVPFEGITRQVIKLAASFLPVGDLTWVDLKTSTRSVAFTLDADGFLQKPRAWTGKRASPGQIQNAIARVSMARENVAAALEASDTAQMSFDLLISRLAARSIAQGLSTLTAKKLGFLKLAGAFKKAWSEAKKAAKEAASKNKDKVVKGTTDMVPTEMVAGLAAGVDPSKPGTGAIETAAAAADVAKDAVQLVDDNKTRLEELSFLARSNFLTLGLILPLQQSVENAPLIYDATMALKKMDTMLFDINHRLSEMEQAVNEYLALVARGQRLLTERQTFRQRTAAVIQGYRTRDAAFRIFRDEKLDRYKTLFDLAAKYTYLAANAYDYETGLLNTDKGRQFVNRIVNSRALGIVKDGQPQYAGSNTGDPGLSSVLAEMKADWDVLRGRLGFNNPTAYGTTVSLRTENHRIVRGLEGDTTWKDVLNQSRKANLLDDADVKRYCMQIDPGNGLPVPGLVVEFGTTIQDSLNLFGRELAGGDHYFDSSYFATKIFSVGVAFEGYVGMDDPVANGTVVGSSGGTSPSDPAASFLDQRALAATPGIYLIPVGVDAMRSPPLGDVSTIRAWTVDDITIPLPFNIGGSEFSTKPLYTSSDSLTEPLFGLRKHPAFRPVSATTAFTSGIYGGGGQLQQSQYTNTRLIGRSVWNTRWKLVVPGYKLLHDPNDGLDRFVNTVKDIKLYLVTYSYAGN